MSFYLSTRPLRFARIYFEKSLKQGCPCTHVHTRALMTLVLEIFFGTFCMLVIKIMSVHISIATDETLNFLMISDSWLLDIAMSLLEYAVYRCPKVSFAHHVLDLI